MKKTISITLSADLLLKIDRLIGAKGSRSAFIEKVLSDHFRNLAREEIGARDLILINANADYLNREMGEVLQDQGDVFEILGDQANTE
jgi:hypothetical protein